MALAQKLHGMALRLGPQRLSMFKRSLARPTSVLFLKYGATGAWPVRSPRPWPAMLFYSTQTTPNKKPEPPAKMPRENPPNPPEPRRIVSKEELLNRATSWWGRLSVRFKWLMIRSSRAFNTDDISAMFSWVLVGHIIWIVLGTTTFISLLIWLLSTARLQDVFAKFVANILTRETGLRVVFEEAIVPDWKQGAIVFNKVFVQRRPGSSDKARVGSQQIAAAAASTAVEHQTDAPVEEVSDADKGNYTQFDLTIDSVSVTLSVNRWLSGRGILKTVDLKGVRGVVDRRHLRWDPNYDAREHRRQPGRGDFDFEAFKLENLLVTVLQPGENKKPINVCVYTCELRRLRKQWLFYDFLNANSMSGSYDNSLFTLHPRQSAVVGEESARTQRLRVDGIDIRHLNTGVQGMFGWIERGNVDFLADVTLPPPPQKLSFQDTIKDVLERWETLFSSEANPELETKVSARRRRELEKKTIVVDLRVQFNNTRAVAPLYTKDLNYINNALIHPIVAYINSRDTYIPVQCRFVKRLTDFDGAWTLFDSGLMSDASDELYTACSQNAADDEARRRRIRKVGMWSLQFLAQLVLLTLGIVA